MKLFKMNVDDIICTVQGDTRRVLQICKFITKNLQFSLEKVNMKKYLAFLDINVNVSSKNNITCHWYQKPTDTGIILNFCCCAPLQHKRNLIQGTVHRVLMQHLIGWSLLRLLTKNKTRWTKSQYPE